MENNKLRDHKKVKIKVEDSTKKDSINSKAQQAATSDDRNGVVVNRARSDRLNKRHSETVGRREVRKAVRRLVRKVSTAAVP